MDRSVSQHRLTSGVPGGTEAAMAASARALPVRAVSAFAVSARVASAFAGPASAEPAAAACPRKKRRDLRTFLRGKKKSWGLGLLLACFFPVTSWGAGAMAVFDVQTFATLKDVFKTSMESLSKLQDLSSTLQTLNTLMGGKLPPGFLTRFQAFDASSHDFSSLLQAVTYGDPLQGLNRIGVTYGGLQDFSNYLYAKEYFQTKFFPASLTPAHLETVQAHKNEAIQTATLDSLALATQQKKTLPTDHTTLQHMSQEGAHNDTLQYQATIQTKLLEQIAYRLEKIILLQAQQLELMATALAHKQPSLYRRTGGAAPREVAHGGAVPNRAAPNTPAGSIPSGSIPLSGGMSFGGRP